MKRTREVYRKYVKRILTVKWTLYVSRLSNKRERSSGARYRLINRMEEEIARKDLIKTRGKFDEAQGILA